jgi:protein-S-isoprenylcysteine O-methyltransferase Ste14
MFLIFPLENFPNKSIAFIFHVVFISFAIVEIYLVIKRSSVPHKKYDRNTLVVLIICCLLWFLISILFIYKKIGNISPIFIYIGIILACIGFIIRQKSVITLGKYFTTTVYIHDNHKLIKKGPYRIIRHPSYTGLLLELLGFSLAITNIYSVVLLFVMIFPILLYRIIIEEKALINEFHQEYKEYRVKTKILVPFLF